jgi:CRP/FNR family transcriptional regulator, cyclic AMP receptor protein
MNRHVRMACAALLLGSVEAATVLGQPFLKRRAFHRLSPVPGANSVCSCSGDPVNMGVSTVANGTCYQALNPVQSVGGFAVPMEGLVAKRSKISFDPKAFLSKVNGGRAISDYRKDQIVYRQGDPADSVFYIQSGKVKKTVLSEHGKEAVVALLGTGDFFGEGCLTGQLLRLATVSAMAECVIVRITKADITRVIHEEPAFAELFIAHLLARNLRVEEDLVDQLFNSSEKRLARVLLLLANFGKEGRPEPILAKISQGTLAEMIGTTRSRVSFFMNKFRELGLIDYNGHIEVHSSLLNVVLHDQPQIKP